jgi:hypothetical protein
MGPGNAYSAPPNGPVVTGVTATGAGPVQVPAAVPMSSANGPMMSNGVNTHANTIQSPMQNLQNRASLPASGVQQAVAGASSASVSQQRSQNTPKAKAPRPSTTNLPAPPLDDVHAAFVEFRAKEDDKVRTMPCTTKIRN